MNDRFKFRGKRLDNNQWYYGSYLYLHNASEYDYAGNRKETKKDVHFIIDENDINYVVNPETVGQCTGLKDKNGKLIYEGDIVKQNNTIYSVNWLNGTFCFKDTLNGENYTVEFVVPEKQEVIGNIYADAHLLEEKEL